jgi:DNA-binding winged helix-turn-helix (wHTH) protein
MTAAGSLLPLTPTLGGLPNGLKPMKLHERLTSSRFDCREESSPQIGAGAGSGPIGQRVEPSIAFGPFRLCPRQRLLLEGDKPLRLGSRALDILIVLLERSGELVSKQELIARVWPGVTVEDGNLKVHIAALRRTLRDGQIGSRYICTVAGRGYCFVAPIERSDGPMPNARSDRLHGLPASPTPSVSGRDLIGMLAAQLSHQHFITVVGAGDMAQRIVLAADSMADYQHGVRFVDLAHLGDPLMVPTAVAAAIGLEVGSPDPLAGITAFLEDKDMLLVLDNCRHIMGAAAAFAVSVLGCAPGVQVLAISR